MKSVFRVFLVFSQLYLLTYIAFNPEFSIVFSSNFRLFLLTIFALNWCATVTEQISFCSGSFRDLRVFFFLNPVQDAVLIVMTRVRNAQTSKAQTNPVHCTQVFLSRSRSLIETNNNIHTVHTLSFYNYKHPKKGHLPILLSRLARDSQEP